MMERIRLWFSRRYCSCLFDLREVGQDALEMADAPIRGLAHVGLVPYVSQVACPGDDAVFLDEHGGVATEKSPQLASHPWPVLGWTRSVNDILPEVSSST